MDERTSPEVRAEADAADIQARRQRRAQRRRERAEQLKAAEAKASAKPQAPAKADANTALARIEPAKIVAADGGGALAEAPQQDPFEVARVAREARMLEIRGELRRRRRWRSAMMLLRFIIFVLGPTAFVGWYYYEKATDMYVAESSMVFKSGGAAAPAGGGLLGGLLGATPTDSIALQEYILSRDIVERLEREHGWISHFQSEDIDEWHRLDADANIDDAHGYYAGNLLWSGKVKVSYDTLEGIVRLEVTGATPEAAKRFADAIISYGEELVNQLNERSRTDGVRMATAQVSKARSGLLEAQAKVASVQEQLNIFSVEAEAGALQGEITALEAEIRAIDAQIENLKTITSNENDTRFVPLRTDRTIKTSQVEALRSQLTGGGQGVSGPSMAQLSSELELARVDQVAAQMMYSSALTSQEAAVSQAAQQSLFLETVVPPKVPEKAAKPYRLQNTGLVFLILFATYIIGLLTISLIREQAAI